MNQTEVVKEIHMERTRQFKKWGDQKHTDGAWMLILQEELGETAEAILKGHPNEHIVEELIQAAAVIAAWIEDRTRSSDEE